nr:MAG TPA: tail fiber protein [Caudoviricetes sp.]
MALKLRTVMTYPLDGSTVDFSITFEYLARKFVSVTLIGKDRKELVLNQDFRFTTKTQITTAHAWSPSDGYTMIEIRRYTSATDRLVDFADGSILRAYDLNIAQIQTLHVAEEARDLTADTISVNNDGHLDARGRRIVNLANAVEDRDAISFGQVKTMNQNSWQARNESLQFRNEAETFRNQAEGFKNTSGTNATNTYKWRNDAEGFRDEAEQFKNTATQQATAASNSSAVAHQSEVNAENSAIASSNSATLAEQQADRAEREADKLGNLNALAGTVQDVAGKDVTWYGVHTAKGFRVNGLINQPSYILGQTDNSDSWYVGKGTAGSSDVALHSYEHNTSILLKSDRIAFNKPLNVNGEVRTLNSALQDDGDIRGGRWGAGTLSATIKRNRVAYQKTFSGTWIQGQTVTFTDVPIDRQFIMIGIKIDTGIEYVTTCTPSAGATFWINCGNFNYRIGMSPDGWTAALHSGPDTAGGTASGTIMEVYVIMADLG